MTELAADHEPNPCDVFHRPHLRQSNSFRAMCAISRSIVPVDCYGVVSSPVRGAAGLPGFEFHARARWFELQGSGNRDTAFRG